jgi:hypothetical protein
MVLAVISDWPATERIANLLHRENIEALKPVFF